MESALFPNPCLLFRHEGGQVDTGSAFKLYLVRWAFGKSPPQGSSPQIRSGRRNRRAACGIEKGTRSLLATIAEMDLIQE